MKSLVKSLGAWLDNSAYEVPDGEAGDRVDWIRCIPFVLLHVSCLGAFFVGFSWTAVAVCVALYLVRMFAITGFYHRYFSHRTYKTSRAFQFIMAVIGNSSAQRGPLWWAANHRHHHKHSDTEEDIHSPHRSSLLWSHMLWLMTRANFATRSREVPDLEKFPELRWLDRFDWVVPVALAFSLLGIGHGLHVWAPQLGVTGLQLVVWGFLISTVLLFHGTCVINSLAHLMGSQPYPTKDESRNSFILSMITLGEGWHNNHHYYPAATRQGFTWWEIDITWYGLKVLNALGLIWSMRDVPPHIVAMRTAKRAR